MKLVLSALAALSLWAIPASSIAAELPTNPRELKYSELKFSIPKADSLRFKLKTGQTVYIAEDHSLPLANLDLVLRAGAFLEPAGKTGLAELTGELMRDGGTTRLTAEKFDEEAAFLAASLNSYIGNAEAGAGLNCLSKDFEKGLDLLFEMMTTPRFQQNRIDVEKGKRLESMKQRNDDADSILSREWAWMMHGENYFAMREQTKSDLDAITRDDMLAFHKQYWRPEGMILAVSGDIDTKKVIAALEKRFASWKPAGPPPKVAWPPPKPTAQPKPGLYLVEKDIPQGKVYIGHTGVQWDAKFANPDFFALQLLNEILGGGGFTSRITKKIRSDEGLAYSAGSSYPIGTYWPSSFRALFQSKNETVAYATKLAIAEIKRIREAPVSDEELATAKASFIDTFPQNFQSKSDTVQLFANDDYMGRPHAYWDSYRDNVRKVTPADIQRVAKQYLRPDDLVIFVVGKWSEIEPGDANKKANMGEFYGGKVTKLPLRDPLTLKPM